MGLDLIEVRTDSPVLTPVITEFDEVLRFARKLSCVLGVNRLKQGCGACYSTSTSELDDLWPRERQ
jgi:hypothetical protein